MITSKLHLQDLIEDIKKTTVPLERKKSLQPLINFVKKTQAEQALTTLNFICTHNSRRSQLSQFWAHVFAAHFNINTNCHSVGVEVTSCNIRTISSLKRFGFLVNKKTNHINEYEPNEKTPNHTSKQNDNPSYFVTFHHQLAPVHLFSKLFNHPSSPKEKFAAVMTCAHAEKNCPYLPGNTQNIPLSYEDPKKFDDTRLEEIKYDERSMQIASEMCHVFSQVK